MIRQTMRQVAAAITVIVLVALGRTAWAVPFTTSHTAGANWNAVYGQGFKASMTPNPDPGLSADDTVYLDRFQFFKSGNADISASFRLAIVNNLFVNLDTFTTSSPELVGLSTNTIHGTSSYATGDPMTFEFDSLELVYGDGEDSSENNYAAIYVVVGETGSLTPVLVPTLIANYVENPPGTGTYVPESNYGDVLTNYFLSTSNFINGTPGSGQYLATFNDYYADASFIAYFNLEASGLPGDYNGDNIVDAADYTVWRNNLGTNFDLNGNGDESGNSMGVVDAADYLWWKNNYGNAAMGGGGLAGAVVPEPSAMALVLLVGSAIVLRARGRREPNVGVGRL